MTGRRMTWVRINGQAEMRTNVRAAIKSSTLTQRATAELASMKPSRLTGFLAHQTWWTRDDAASIASVLTASGHPVTVADLIGGSVFRADPWAKMVRFNYPPALDGSQATPGPSSDATKTRALCCQCGSLQQINIRGGDKMAAGEDAVRWVLPEHCATCGATTQHAILRWGEHRDYAEQRDHAPTSDDVARTALRALLTRLGEFNVEVSFRAQPKRKKDAGKEAFVVGYEFDESKSQWLIEVDPALPARMQLEMLEDIWTRISTDEHHVDWDAREGVITRAAQRVYDTAVEELMGDLDRYLSLERRRLVQGVVDDLASADVRQALEQDSEVDR